MKQLNIISKSTQQTVKLGEKLARIVFPGSIFCLFGDLGSGKTTLVKGVAKGLGISAKKVNSPSFVLMNIYKGKLPLYHFDLYRLENSKNIADIGYDEFLYGKGVAIIEWAERAKKIMPKEYLKIVFKHKSINERRIKIIPKGSKYKEAIKKRYKDI